MNKKHFTIKNCKHCKWWIEDKLDMKCSNPESVYRNGRTVASDYCSRFEEEEVRTEQKTEN